MADILEPGQTIECTDGHMGKDQYFLRNLCSNFGPFYRKLPSLWGVQDGAFRRGSGEAGTFTSRMSRKETG